MDDKDARYHIINTLKENYFVEASAGSGKTTSLVYRMVALIEKGEATIDQICTITFTKAAADEFFARFQKLLSIRSVLTPDKETDDKLGKKNDESIARCQKALANIDSCFLGTIDAFLNMVAHEMPNEIHVPSDSEVISDEERNTYVKLVYESIIRNVNDPLHDTAIKLHQLVYKPYECFATIVKNVSDNRGSIIDYDKSFVDPYFDVDEYFKNEKDDFLEIARLVAETNIKYGGASLNKERSLVQYRYSRVKSSSWKDVLHYVKQLAESLLKFNNFPKKQVEDSTNSEIQDILIIKPGEKSKSYIYNKDTDDTLHTVLQKINDYIHALYLDLCIKAEEVVSKVLKKEGRFSYNDYLYYVRDAFRDSAKGDRALVNHIYSRHTHFLLDENQDTNPVQTEIFFYLAGLDYKDDWTKITLRPGSIFIVGDPKQSIYAFRGANVRAYLKTKESFYNIDDTKNRVLVLTRNFRSNHALREWFNKTMDDILNHAPDNLEHKKIPTDDVIPLTNALGPNDIPLDGVYKYSVSDPNDDPKKIANMINTLVNDKHYKIMVKGTDEDGNKYYKYRSIVYSDFLIVPRVVDILNYVDEFKKYNIPTLLEAQIPFEKSESLPLLIDLTILFKNPNNKAQLLKVLTGPLYLLNDLDTLSYYNDGFRYDISDLSMYDASRVVPPPLRELHNLYEVTKDMSISSTMLYILNDQELKLLKKCNNAYLEYTYFVIEKVKEQEEAGNLSNVNELADFLNKYIYKKKKEDNRVLRFKDKEERVKIANLHKVKGLEAPIVILIKPRGGKKVANSYIDYSGDTPVVYYAVLDREDNNGNKNVIAVTSRYDDATLDSWNASLNAEDDRLQYVAATRAKSVLIVSSYPGDPNYVNVWDKLTNHIDDQHVLPNIAENDPTAPVDSKADYIESTVNNKPLNRDIEKPSTIYRTPSTGRVLKISNDDVTVEINKEATLLGTMIHKVLELIVRSRNGYKDIHALTTNVVFQYVKYDHGYVDIIEKVASTFINGGHKQKNSIFPDDLLSILLKAEEVYCETPFSYRKGDTIINGVIDLLYKDDGGYHVIDYKTNKEDDVSILEKEYQSQLQDYIDSLKENGIAADAHIYHIAVE